MNFDSPLPMPDGAEFGVVLRRYRLRAALSQNALAKAVSINASYVNRLESGERGDPTREVALALARALGLAPEETDRLLFSAGYVPPSLQKLGSGDSTIAAVAKLLTDDRLSPECRADFRACVEVMASRWRASAGAITRLAPKAQRVTITGVISAVGAER